MACVQSGYICICLPAARLADLEIKMMVEDNQEKHRTAYTVTCDYKHGQPPSSLSRSRGLMGGCFAGTTTGISAHDRALTALKLADPTSKPDDFTRPGHMVPLRAVEGGVLTRRGHTEASVGAFTPPFCSITLPRCSSFLLPNQTCANSQASHPLVSSANSSSPTTRSVAWRAGTTASRSRGRGGSR